MLTFSQVIDRFRAKGIRCDTGLSDSEIVGIEQELDFGFPPDVRDFLQTVVPISAYFPNWRDDLCVVRARYIDPITTRFLFGVEQGFFWFPNWGEQPVETSAAIEVARSHLCKVPKLVPLGDPLYLKCIPCNPCLSGNPVFSVRGPDVLHAGRNIGEYLEWLSESNAIADDPTPVFGIDYRSIDFWTDVARWNVTERW